MTSHVRVLSDLVLLTAGEFSVDGAVGTVLQLALGVSF